MPLNMSRYTAAPYQDNSTSDKVNPFVPTSTGINVGGSVQVTGVLLLGVLILVLAIAKSMGGIT